MDAVKTGALIAQARKEKELTQKDLAQGLHVSIQAVSKWERGLNFPDIALLEPLAELLGLTVSELLSGERDTAPGEELVRSSLRMGVKQLGGKARHWRQLFVALALVVIGMGGFFSYRWVRDNTEWLPQKETVLIPQQVSESDQLLARLTGPNILGTLEVLRADDYRGFQVQLERWNGGEMTDCHYILSGSGYDSLDMPRRDTMAYLLQIGEGELLCSFSHGGAIVRSRSFPIPEVTGWGWTTLDDPIEVDRETGTVIACIGLDVGNGIRTTQVGNYAQPELETGQTFLLLRLVVE